MQEIFVVVVAVLFYYLFKYNEDDDKLSNKLTIEYREKKNKKKTEIKNTATTVEK